MTLCVIGVLGLGPAACERETWLPPRHAVPVRGGAAVLSAPDDPAAAPARAVELSTASPAPEQTVTGTGAPAKAPERTATGTAAPEMTATGTSAAADAGPFEVSATSAVLIALENNPQLAVDRLKAAVVKAGEELAGADFDPVLSMKAGFQQFQDEQFHGAPDFLIFPNRVSAFVGGASVEKLFPTGATVGVGVKTEVYDERQNTEMLKSSVGLTVTQALLRGRGTDVNLAAVRQARLDTLASEYELRGFTEALVEAVEAAYWDYVFAVRQLAIRNRAVAEAGQQTKNVQEMVKGGALPALELKATEAEAARQRQDLVDARADMDKARVRLVRLLNPPGANRWTREIRVPDMISVQPPDVNSDEVAAHVELAMRMRPDINQARLAIQRGELQIVKTRDGLLPKLDFFLTLARTGYGETLSASARDAGGFHYDFLTGLSAQYNIGNHDALARDQQAALGRRQADEALKNLQQLAEADVLTALIEADRALNKAAAVSETRKLDEEQLKAEIEKFKTGRGSTFQVARAQRDLVSSQLAEVQAAVDRQKALSSLYRTEGSLLERRGVSAPGRQPPGPLAWSR